MMPVRNKIRMRSNEQVEIQIFAISKSSQAAKDFQGRVETV
jgi:hypothetical protein